MAGAEHEVSALLTATPAMLHVRWRLFLSEGVPAQCSHPDLDIAAFEISACDAVGDQLLKTEMDCGDPPDDNLGYHLVEDPDRAVKGTQVALVVVAPLDQDGNEVLDQSYAFEFEEPGPGRSRYFTVDCTLNECEQSMDPVDQP